jgi:large repetitive protein
MRIANTLLVIGCCLTISGASPLQPHFSPKDIVNRVRSAHPVPGGHISTLSDIDDGGFLVDTSITCVFAPDYQGRSAVAFDGTNFLVVWYDGRGSQRGVYGSRVTQQGTLLDPAGIVISEARCDDYDPDPAVAFGGSEFLVVWTEEQDGRIHGARVSLQGLVLDPAGIGISRAEVHQCLPSVGFDGANFLVAWQDYRDSTRYADIYGTRVSPQGSVLDTADIAISRAMDEQCYVAVGFDGANLLVAWEDYRNGHDANIHGARVTPAGRVLDTTGFVILQGPDDQCNPALAFDGANFLVVSEDWDSGGDIHGARVTPAGMVLDTVGFAISHGTGSQDAPAVAFDGTSFLVAYEDRDTADHIRAARVTSQGNLLDTAGIAISPAQGGQYRPAVAYGGASYLATWDNYRNSDDDVCGARVTPAGVVLDSSGIDVSLAANDQQSPAIAFDGTNFLVAWQDYRDGSGFTDIYGARVSPEGAVLDPTGFVISHAADDQRDPALVFDGANFLVVWDDGRDGGDWDILGARVTPQGILLDSAGFVISHAQFPQCYPAVASSGTNCFVVWYDWRNDCVTPKIYGARVTPQGTVLDTEGIAISRTSSDQYYPAVASDGTNYLVVWSDWGSGSGNVFGARVTPQGTVLDSVGFDISRAPSGASSPDLCFDGTNYLVVWDDYRSLDWRDIYGARVTSQGTVLDSFVVSHASGGRSAPASAFDGANFLVAWHDSRNGTDCDIHGARVTPGGTVFDGGSILSKQGNQLYPRLCRGSSGQMSLVYQDWAGTLGGKTYNAERVWGMMDPNPAITEVTKPGVRLMNRGATIIRGVLMLGDRGPKTGDRAQLLDVSGRKVMELRAGANDVRALAAGVYFIKEGQGIGGEGLGKTRKIILAE